MFFVVFGISLIVCVRPPHTHPPGSSCISIVDVVFVLQQVPAQYSQQGMGGYCQQGQPPYFSPPHQQPAAPSQPHYMQPRAPPQQVSHRGDTK